MPPIEMDLGGLNATSVLLKGVDDSNERSATGNDCRSLCRLQDDAERSGDLDDSTPCRFHFEIFDQGLHYFRFLRMIDAAERSETRIPAMRAMVCNHGFRSPGRVARMLASGADTPTMPLPASGRLSSGFISSFSRLNGFSDC